MHSAMHTHMNKPSQLFYWLDLAFLCLYCVFQLICVRCSFSELLFCLIVRVCVLFSECELTFTYVRYMLSLVRLSVCRVSVCLSSIVCNVRAPYSGGSNFPQCFYHIRYLIGHLLTSTENFTEVVPGNPSAGGVKHKRGSQI